MEGKSNGQGLIRVGLPVFEGDTRVFQARLLQFVSWALGALSAALLVADLLGGPLLGGGRVLAVAVLLGAAAVAGLLFHYQKRLETGSLAVVLLTLAAYIVSVVWPPLYLAAALVLWGILLLVAGLLLGRVWVFTLGILGVMAMLLPGIFTPPSAWPWTATTSFLMAAGLGVFGYLVYLASDMAYRYQAGVRELQRTLHQTEATLQGQVEERTRALALAARVGRQITRVRELDTLLHEAVELICERFNLYYAQIYLLNPVTNDLELRAGTGTVGEELLRRGHRLPVGPGSINGTAALSRQPIAVAFARESPIFLPNPLLPETQSELAVPMIIEEEVIGVLNLQDNIPGSLGDENIAAYTALAAQLAVAVVNARLFEEVGHTREELARQARVLTQDGWNRFLSDHSAHVVWEGDGTAVSEEAGRLVQPIDVRGTTIGLLELGTKSVVEDDQVRSLVAAVAGQLGAHLENLRLTQQAEEALDEARRRSVELEIINRVVTAVAASTDLQQSLQVIVDELAEATSIKQIGIAILNEERTHLTVVADRSERLRSPSAVGVVIPLENNPSSQMAIRDKRPVIVDNAMENPLTASAHEVLRQRGVRSIVILPLVVGNQVIGTVGLDVVEEGVELTETQLRLAETIVSQAAAAVQRARLFEQTDLALRAQARLSAELRTVAEVSIGAAGMLETDRLLSTAADLTKESFDLYHAHIYLLDESGELLMLRAGSGRVGKRMVRENWVIPVTANSIVARAARDRDVVIVADTREAEDFLPHPLLPETRSELAVPIAVGERLLGVLDVQADTAGRFRTEDVQVYQILASQLAVAIQNADFYTQQLETAEKLREVDRLKTDFLARMSHELRTPLNSIIGFADVLLMGLDGELTERMVEDLQLIRSSGYHLRDIIGDILDMSKIEAGRLELSFESFDIRRVAAELMATAAPLAEQKGLNLQLDIAEDVGTLSADRTRVRQVLWNIVGNAIKFTDHGDVRVSVRRDNGEVIFIISDTGVGIAPEELPHVFEQFRQVDLLPRGSIGGTGLGLSISKSLIELHGGRIWAESEPGKGSTFGFMLPVAPSSEAVSISVTPIVRPE
jgi:signal transduction histidine kinase